MPGLGFKHIPHVVFGAEDHRVSDESLLIFLEGMVRKDVSELLSSGTRSEAWGLCPLAWQRHRTRSHHLQPRDRRHGRAQAPSGWPSCVAFSGSSPHPQWETWTLNWQSRSPHPPHSTTGALPALDQHPCPADLHFANFVGLEFRCAVVVDEANAACELQKHKGNGCPRRLLSGMGPCF